MICIGKCLHKSGAVIRELMDEIHQLKEANSQNDKVINHYRKKSHRYFHGWRDCEFYRKENEILKKEIDFKWRSQVDSLIEEKILMNTELEKYVGWHKEADSAATDYMKTCSSLKDENDIKSIRIEKLHIECGQLKEHIEAIRSGHWKLIEENLKLKAAKPAPSMFIKCPEDAKEIKRLKKKVNRLIVKKNMAENGWNVYGIYYRGKDYEEILQEIPKQNIWLKFNMEAMRAEYKECWDYLKDYHALVESFYGLKSPLKADLYFKPSDKFIKE